MDRSTHHRRGNGAPIEDSLEITPDDDTDLPFFASAIMVGVEGDVTYLPPEGATPRRLPNLVAGVFHRVRARRIMATGTTADDIVIGD